MSAMQDVVGKQTRDLAVDFAKLTVSTKYETLGGAAQERAKQSILDTLGVIIAASSLSPEVQAVVDLVSEMGGREEATVLGFGGAKLPALSAAFANGAMAHCLDFDDHAPEGHHPSSSIVPVVFALAERALLSGRAVSGRELVTAVAIGQDIFMRLRRNVEWKQDWHLTTIVGVFSATAAGARILGFSEAQIVSAFGIAGAQASGTMELAYGTGSELRGMYAGFIAKQAVLSVLMAEKGITGPASAFEGKAGFFATYLGNRYDRAAMVEGLGQRFTGQDLLYKAWPSCGLTHSYIHATACVMREQGLKAADLHEIRVYTGDFQEKLCIPLETRRAPKVAVDAKFSIPWCVGVAAVRGTVGLADFTQAGLADLEVQAAAAKVVPVSDPRQNWGQKLPHARIEVETLDGRVFERIGDNVPGEIEAPMDQAYLNAKFREAVSFARVKLHSEAIARAELLIRELDLAEDAVAVIRALS